MPIDTDHPEYCAAKAKWRTVRDAAAGEIAVKAAGQRYLPANPNQTVEEYDAYRMRGSYLGATGRTITALSGLIFRKAVTVVAPDAVKALLEDVTMGGESIEDLAKRMAIELLTTNRLGLLVDFPSAPLGEDGKPIKLSNAAQATALGMRPFVSFYGAESIRNWDQERVNNKRQPTLIVLDESGPLKRSATDRFVREEVERRRELRLEGGIYVQEVHTKNTGGWASEGVTIPQANAKSFTYLPFVPVSGGKLSLDVVDPSTLPLAEKNLSHYRTRTQYKHGAFYTALPTSVMTGYTKRKDAAGKPIDEKFPIGSSQMLVLPDKDTKVWYHEFKGDGLGTLERELDREEREMALLGAHLMTPQKAGVEAVGTAQIRTAGETSVLAEIATTISRALTRVAEILGEWVGASGEISVTVNKDFMPASIDPQLFAQLLAAVQAGTISPQTFFWNLQQGELIEEGKTFEEEEAQISASTPALTLVAPPAPLVPPAKKVAEA